MARLFAALLLLALGCAGVAPPPPVPESIVPSVGAGDAEVEVRIEGKDFRAWVESDFRKREASTVHATFTARLVPSDGAGEDVALKEVQLVDHTLTGVVPAGVAHLVYDLVIHDPRGAEGVLPRAYRAVPPAESVAAFTLEPPPSQRVGVPFLLTLAAVDGAGRVVDGFSGEVTASDRTGTLTPRVLGPFVRGRLQVPLTVGKVSAADVIHVAGAAGQGDCAPFEVTAGLVDRLALRQPGQRLVAGDCSGKLELAAVDASGAPAGLEAPLEVALSSGPGGALRFFSDAACTSGSPTLTLAGTDPSAIYFRGELAGSATLRATAGGLALLEQREEIVPAPPAALTRSATADSLKVSACAEVLLEPRDRFGNLSPSGAGVTLALASSPAGPLRLSASPGCAVAAGEVTLAPGASSASLFLGAIAPGSTRVSASGPGLPPLEWVVTVVP